MRRPFLSRLESAASGPALCALIGLIGAPPRAHTAAPQEPLAAEAPNYEDHIKPIFREHCLKCHGEDEQKADLNLSSFAALNKGGSGGAALTPGRASTSLLFKAITAEDDSERMPPKKPPLPAVQIERIKAWIQAGIPEKAGGTSLAAARNTEFKPVLLRRNGGPAPAPVNWPPLTPPVSLNPLPVTALAASPVAPIYAATDLQSVRVHSFNDGSLLGVLPFPDGQANVLRFSQDGSLLLVAGGEPVQHGVAALFEVRSGKRLATLGDETDAVLAADLSPDLQTVALGGPGKSVKILSTRDGRLLFKLGKHTDWITALAFSPDGTKLASADRAGGLHLWEAASGQIFLTLAEHKGPVRSLAWRGDGRILASAGDDGLLILWDATDGWPVSNNATAHQPRRPEGVYGKLPAGVLGVAFSLSGELLSVGRDRAIKRWTPEGRLLQSVASAQLPLQCAFSADGSAYVVGGAQGLISIQSLPPQQSP